ncbi:hypothetical protein KY285_007838 [Solanum tuberosum]|nr:hypothetical protein KY285_007838 [Solanum tuberosum]
MEIFLRSMIVTWLMSWVAPLVCWNTLLLMRNLLVLLIKKGTVGDHEGERVDNINENENEFEAATTQHVASQSSPVGDLEAVAPTQASTTTTATVEPETDSDHKDLFNEGDVQYESNVHEENINLRAERRSYQKRKRTKRVPKDPEEVPVAEVGPDVGFDETELIDKNLKDNETSRDSRRIIFDNTAGKEYVAAGPSNEAGTSRPILRPRGRPRKTPTTTTNERHATYGEPPRPKGRPRKTNVKPDAPPPRPRGRPRKTTNNEAPARGRGRTCEPIATSTIGRGIGRADTTPARGRSIGIGRGREMNNTTVQAPGRGRGFKVPLSGIGVPKRTSLRKWFENPTSYTTNAPPNPHVSPVHSQSNAVPTKRSRTVGMGDFIAENGLTTYILGLQSNRILYTGSEQPINSADVTGDLGFKQRTGVRWKGKKAMTSNQLEVIRDGMRVNKRQKKASSQSKEQWK